MWGYCRGTLKKYENLFGGRQGKLKIALTDVNNKICKELRRIKNRENIK